MFNLLKSKRRFTIVFFMFLIGFTAYGIFSSTSKNSGTPAPTTTPLVSSIATWGVLTPGVSTQQDVVNELGEPKTTKGETLSFKSSSPARDDQAIIENGTVNFMKEAVAASEKRTTTEITSKYGTAQYILYGPDSINGFNLYIYPDNGIAYIGNTDTGGLLEIWYFKPTTIENFTNTWASGYSTSPKTGQF